jgi:tetratricopeptide (TPR) repeat protein
LGKYKEAEDYFMKALKIREKELGFDHPSTANTYWWLATLYEKNEDYKKAESFYIKTIDIFTKVLGEDHSNTINVKGFLENLYTKMGN